MSLKRKIALNLSIAFSVLFGIVMIVIYFSFNDFRKNEFRERFEQRLQFTIHFIARSSDVQKDFSDLFNENEDNILLNEKITIYNSRKQLIYPADPGKAAKVETGLLNRLDGTNTIYDDKSDPEVYAAMRNINGENYYILTTANDINGRTKLTFLKYLLLFSFILSTSLIWIFSYYIVNNDLRPLEDLNRQISEITAHKLTTTLPMKTSKDEISIIAESFNTMVGRLNEAFESQKYFTASASHEIRTPITRMAFKLENLIKLGGFSPEHTVSLKQIQQDVYQLSDLTNSLLLLTRFDSEEIQSIYKDVRIDEVIFNAFATIEKSFPDLKMNFVISGNTGMEEDGFLTVSGVKSLLEIVFINLLKNAAVYSENAETDVIITENEKEMLIEVVSRGKVVAEDDREKLFDAFKRGANSRHTAGSGLGLRIVQRILNYHGAAIRYSSPAADTNVFTVIFPKA